MLKWMLRTALVVVVLDLLLTIGLWAFAARSEQTASLDGGVGVVFYSEDVNERAWRVDHAVDLLQSGKLDRVIATGGNRPAEGKIGAVDMALLMIARGIEPERVLVDEGSNDTISSVANSLDLAKAAKLSDVAFVSDCLHLLRVRAAVSVVDDKAEVRFACPEQGVNPLRIWRKAHYELGAGGLLLLPESWKQAIVDWLRP